MKIDIQVQDNKGLNESNRKSEFQDKAEEIIKTMQKHIAKKYPVLYVLIYSMKFVPVVEDICLETDGINIFYSPEVLVKRAKSKNMSEVEYSYIHIMMHGLLNHYTKAYEYEKDPVMHILMDYEVKRFMNRMNIKDNRMDTSKCYSSMEMERNYGDKNLSAMHRETINNKLLKYIARKVAKYLWRDDYMVWTRNRKFRTTVEIEDNTGNDGSDNQDKSNNERYMQIKKFWNNISDMILNGKDSGNDLLDALRRNKSDTKQHGMSEGKGEEIVVAKKQAQIDYKKVMKKFFKMQETTKENVETIDKAMYSWGMSMYDDIAFIEPEAESENLKMNTIVLAIDTSGSCMGSILEQFLAETKGIFNSLTHFDFEKFVIIQCDAQIQKVNTYKNVKSFPEMSDFDNGYQMYGFGGTDFTPVFDYIHELETKKEKVDCLIYLTDGFGEYPDNPPDSFKTFFVLDNDSYAYYEQNKDDNMNFVPDWVEVLKLK